MLLFAYLGCYSTFPYPDQYPSNVSSCLDLTFNIYAYSQAGIDLKRLQLANEPDAASNWCLHETTVTSHALSEPGTHYMVVDLGGKKQ